MIPAAEFARRRRQLMRMAGGAAAVVVAAAPTRLRNADNYHPYRQDSDFHYLSGFPEPDAVLLLLPGRDQAEVVLFCRESDRNAERWDGERIGSAGAVDRFGMDDAFPIDDIDDILPGMIEGRERLYCHFGREAGFDQRLLSWLRRLRQARGGGNVPKEFVALSYLLHDLRLFKSRNELRLMRRAAKVAVKAHLAAWQVATPGRAEYEVEAELHRVIRGQGAVPSYPAMVASGANACTMHYRANNALLEQNKLLMIDAGAEVDCYASDITRTVPVSGRWSGRQRALYEIVVAAQDAAIATLRPGKPFRAAHDAALRVSAEGLCDLRLLKMGPAEALESGALERFFPHKTSHWLGLDVHDVGDYRVDGQSRVLEPGMVIAVEPGIYIDPTERGVSAAWRGMAVRIEDDVAVTRSTPEVLTAAMPRSAEDIEHLLAQR